jgi:hypothetical protein
MAERTPARSAGPAPASSARMLPANVAPCAAPARPLATSNDATTQAGRRRADGHAPARPAATEPDLTETRLRPAAVRA